MLTNKIFLLLFICISSGISAQSTYLPLNPDAYHFLDRFEIKADSLSHTFFSTTKPYSRKAVAEYALWLNKQELTYSGTERRNIYYFFKENNEWMPAPIESKRPVLKHFYKTPANLFELNEENFMFRLNPVLQFEVAKELDSKEPKFINTRGLEARGWIAKRVGFYTYLTENQAYFPEYVQSRIKKEPQAIPGIGYYKNDFRTRFAPTDSVGVDFFEAKGYITFDAIKDHISVQFGHDKNFIGDGIRSLMLSDHSANYLFLKLNTRVWKIEYQNLFTELVGQYNRGGDTLLPKKFGTFHHLSFNATRWLRFGLFESVVFSRDNSYDLNYLNPIIFYRAIERDLGSPDNAFVGINFRALAAKRFSFYGQFILDEFNFYRLIDSTGWWGNKYGLQLGAKYIDVAGISNLDVQLEGNVVRPYTYTHFDEKANYSHYNQPLAHPLGANFEEIVGKIYYQPHYKLMLTTAFMYALHGTDTAGVNWGGDIFKDYTTYEKEYHNYIGQGLQNKIFIADITASYQWKHNFYFYANYFLRSLNSEKDVLDNKTHYFGAGIRWNIAAKEYYF